MATALIQPPAPFEPGSRPAQAWEDWRASYELYEEACEYTTKGPGPRRALLLHVIGPTARKTYKGFVFPTMTADSEEQPPRRETSEDILNKFEELYQPYKNVTHSSAIFNSIIQKPNQTIDELVAELKIVALDCEYGDSCDRMIGDRIIIGVRDTALRERLLREPSLKLDKIINICKSAEISKTQSKFLQPMIATTSSPEVDALNIKYRQDNKKVFKPNRWKNSKPHAKYKPRHTNADQNTCSRCGSTHLPRNCPAYGTNCHQCGKFGHFARVCKKRPNSTRNQSVSAITSAESAQSSGRSAIDEDLEDYAFLGELSLQNEKIKPKWWTTLTINKNDVYIKIDTGSEVNLLSKTIFDNWKEAPPIERTNKGIITYSKQKVNIVGESKLHCFSQETGKSSFTTFFVTEANLKPILGADTSEELGLVIRSQPSCNVITSLELKPTVTAQQIINSFPDVFTGIGKLHGTVHITISPDAIPNISAPRNIPQALQSRVKAELERMINAEIIVKVTEPSEWVHPLAIATKKNGGIRLCLDPRKLNLAIQREHYKLPTQEELLSRLEGRKIFSLFDASDAFWNLQLDDESSRLCTFATPYGRYRFLRMPFGVKSAPEQFQRAMDSIFSNRDEFCPYFDDILVAAKTEEEHCRLIHKLLTLARAAGLKFNKQKIKLNCSSIQYLGHLLSAKGISPDPKKVNAVESLKPPANKEELMHFMGMVTYLTKYIPHFSQETNQLRALLKASTPWLWDKNTDKEFQRIKSLVTTAPVLKFFDPNVPITISTDASSYGIGSVLLQAQSPVAYASATLTPTQRAWAQIEKELLAVVHACEHFHYYIFGTPVTVQTDHKPLLGLLNKPLEKITPRLQRLILRLQRYDVTLHYIPGKFLNVADTLSRAPSTQQTKPLDFSEDITVCTLALATTPKLEEIRAKTAQDSTLQQIVKFIKTGWPKLKQIEDAELQQFNKCKDELHIVNGLICRGQRLVLPKEAQTDALKQLHLAHRGIVATKNKARQALYWPNMNVEIENLIGNCITCQRYQNNNAHEPLADRTLPVRPWQHLALDFFYLKQVNYLLVIDYFSKFVEVQPLKSTAAKGVILALKAIFAQFGLPDTLASHNGPPMDSSEIQTFLKEWDIRHNPSSPYNPRSNGLVERSVQTLKKSLTKAAHDGEDLFTVLMDHRNTPSNGLKSPAELLMGRRIRTMIPILPSKLKPEYKIIDTCKQLKQLQINQHKHGDLHTKPLGSLNLNQDVWFALNKSWSPGKIIQTSPRSRSYIIKATNGRSYKRNRYHLKTRTNNITRDIPDSAPDTAENYYSNSGNQQNQSNQTPVQQTVSQQTEIPKNMTRSGRVILPPARFKDYC